MTYTIRENRNLEKPFIVWVTFAEGNGRMVKTFKTRKGAENWIKANA